MKGAKINENLLQLYKKHTLIKGQAAEYIYILRGYSLHRGVVFGGGITPDLNAFFEAP